MSEILKRAEGRRMVCRKLLNVIRISVTRGAFLSFDEKTWIRLGLKINIHESGLSSIVTARLAAHPHSLFSVNVFDITGITKFADMAPDEFKEIYLNLDYEKKTLDPSKPHPGKGIKPLKPGQEAVADWTGNYTTPIKDQGVCGSCWAFSVTEQIESDWMRSGGEMLILSAQQVCSCTSYLLKPIVGGCRGGKPEKGFEYAEKPGLELDADYPYTSGRFGKTGDCSADKGKAVVKTSGFTNVAAGQKGAEELMAAYVGGTGPLSIVVDASEWSTYTGGVVSSCGEDVDHAVQVVGVDTVQGFWKVRNTWGTSWGESGFIRLAFGNNTCAITTDANYATVLSA
mmetsp:Transcript_51217/g.116425  ORF Transcript_51217/g.116425 Transcript_51217/m.116425 type:complete len:342 (+) Transcript_51217:307-1332(+)